MTGSLTGALTIGEVSRRTGIAQTTLRYYEQIGLLPAPDRVGGQRRYQGAVLVRLEINRACKTAGFALEDIAVLIGDDTPGRPASRALAQAKLAEIDVTIASLLRAKETIRRGMECQCPSIDACACGIDLEPVSVVT